MTPNGSASHKRSASESSSVVNSGNSNKRARSSADDDDSDVEVVHDSRDTHAENPTEDKSRGKKKAQDNTSLFSTNNLLKKYRLDPKALGSVYLTHTAVLSNMLVLGKTRTTKSYTVQ
jgi:hypothetical protein